MKATSFILFLVLSCLVLAGVQTTCFVRANFMNEPEKISVILLSPENKTYTPGNVRLTFRVSHWLSSDIDTWFTLDNQASIQLFPSSYLGMVGASIYDSNLTGLGDGSHVIGIRSSFGKDSSTAEVLFTVDSVPPTISNISVENRTYAEADLTFNYTISEQASWVAYSLDHQANVSINSLSTLDPMELLDSLRFHQINVSMDGYTVLTNLTEGLHRLTIYANDTAGNMGMSETVIFTIAVPEPFPVVPVAAASIAVAVGAVVGVLFYFKKRSRKAESQA